MVEVNGLQDNNLYTDPKKVLVRNVSWRPMKRSPKKQVSDKPGETSVLNRVIEEDLKKREEEEAGFETRVEKKKTICTKRWFVRPKKKPCGKGRDKLKLKPNWF